MKFGGIGRAHPHDRIAELVPAKAIHLAWIGRLDQVAKPAYELERREYRVGLERAAEHPELDGVLVGDVHRVVAVALRVPAHRLRLHHPAAVGLGRVAARGPAVDLLALPAGEVDDGLEEPIDRLDELELGELLRHPGLAEEVATHMDVQPAGRGVVASHPLCERCLADVAPHLLSRIRHHVLGAHGMRHELTALVEASVVLEVEGVAPVHRPYARRRCLRIAQVHLELHAQVEAGRLRIGRVAEYRCGLEVVGLDGLPVVVGGAGPAVAPALGLARVARAEQLPAAVASREAREALVADGASVVRGRWRMELGLVELAAEAACVSEFVGAASAEDVRLGGGEHLLGEVVAVAMIALGVSRFGAARADVLDRRARGLEDGLAMPAEAQQSLALGRVGSPRSGSRGSSWHLDRPFLLRALHARERR